MNEKELNNRRLAALSGMNPYDGVFIERAAPLTVNGIASMGCTEEEYKWYCKGLEDGKKLTHKTGGESNG